MLRSFGRSLQMLGQQRCDMLCWDVAIVWPGLRNSLLAKAFIEMVTDFCERPGTKFLSPIFHNALNAGLPSFVFTRWQTQYTEREHVKQDFISFTLVIIMAPILKVVTDLFQTFHSEGSIWFRYQMTVHGKYSHLISEQTISECNLKTVILYQVSSAKIQQAITLNFTSSQHLVTTLGIMYSRK